MTYSDSLAGILQLFSHKSNPLQHLIDSLLQKNFMNIENNNTLLFKDSKLFCIVGLIYIFD